MPGQGIGPPGLPPFLSQTLPQAEGPEPVETFAAQPHYGDIYENYLPEDDPLDANDSTLEVSAIMVAVGVGGDELGAAQDYADDYPHDLDTEDPWWNHVYGFPDYPPEALAPPEIVLPELLNVFPTFTEHDFSTLVPAETNDYANDSTLEAPYFFKPAGCLFQGNVFQNNVFQICAVDVTPIAAQPLAEHDFGTLVPEETQDYAQPPEQNEWLASPEAPLETFAAQPTWNEHDAETLVPVETQDYSNDTTLDISHAIAPPEVIVPELLIAQPHYGEAFWPDEETQDYANDSALDVTYLTASVPVQEPDTTFAAQPHYGEADWSAEETSDYQADSTLEVPAALVPVPPTDSELAAAQAAPDHDFTTLIAPETEDYSNDSTIDVAALTPTTAQEPDSTFAAQPHYGDIPDLEETQDYSNDSALDVSGLFAEQVEIHAAQYGLDSNPVDIPEPMAWGQDPVYDPLTLFPAPVAPTFAELGTQGSPPEISTQGTTVELGTQGTPGDDSTAGSSGEWGTQGSGSEV